ncbi:MULTISPECIES: hypothetical protein [Rothia]|uniref:hypothetical protein n=1 Tax=Rothia TaxID=32207 RepID=UPI00079CA615|nr:hypothetical protein [Rothia kristinae]TDP52389.1 hypothetical protein DEU33_1969 [Kocuria sp. AG109]KTR40669.1 membrane protein [Rothia kristinae]KTR58343.1 membrane protein [Rothia kristinae]KTR64493.1 membrane protein [Rothia kristinae]KTR73890.1 membrane protein [Rothia kristinae]
MSGAGPANGGSDAAGAPFPAAGQGEAGRTITRRESLGILAASMLAAASALVATVLAARALDERGTTEFLVFWSLLFGVFGVMAGVQPEATRAVGAARLRPRDAGGSAGARVLPVALGFGAAAALLLVGGAPLWAASFLPTGTGWAVALLGAGVLLYAGHAAMSGISAGRDQWTLFAVLGGGEALWRLVAMFGVALIAASVLGLEAAAVSAVLLWILLTLACPGARAASRARADVPAPRLVRNILLSMGSSASSAVLMVGFPFVLRVTEGGGLSRDQSVLLGGLILAISITRSPIMIPLQAFQGVAISAFLKQRHRPIAAMAKPVGALLGVGALGAALAGSIGPWLFVLIYGPTYDGVIRGGLLAVLTFGSAVMAALVLSGTAVLALDAHRLYVSGWAVAALTAIGLLFLPLDLVPRAVAALYLGPAAGFGVHLAGMRRVVRPPTGR